MNAKVPSPGERRGWHLRNASAPSRPVVHAGCSARGLLVLLDAEGTDEARATRKQLASALAHGRIDEARAAMDHARRVLPAQPTLAAVVEAELAAVVASMSAPVEPLDVRPGHGGVPTRREWERASAVAAAADLPLPPAITAPARPVYARPDGPDPHQVLAVFDRVLVGELSRSTRWSLEQHRRDLARVLASGAKKLGKVARSAELALQAHQLEAEHKRSRTRRAPAPTPTTEAPETP